MNGLQRRSKLIGNAICPLLDGSRTFQHNNQAIITDGHIFRLVHPSVSYSIEINISDLSYNGNNEYTTDNYLSTAEWLKVKAGDVLSYDFHITQSTLVGNVAAIGFNFILMLPGGVQTFKPVQGYHVSDLTPGQHFTGEFVFTDPYTFTSLCTWHSYKSGATYDVTYDIRIWLNGKRVV